MLEHIYVTAIVVRQYKGTPPPKKIRTYPNIKKVFQSRICLYLLKNTPQVFLKRGPSFTVTPKLPKLVLQKFNGEIKKFRTFWDRFDSSVKKNPNISPIDKFNYLQGLLEGPAARVIQGLPLTEANYNVALNLLQGHFGNTQHIISMHMDELLQLPTCSGNKPAELRLICDKVGVNVRGLESLEVTSDKYGSFLVPIIMSKISTRCSSEDRSSYNERCLANQRSIECIEE